MAKQEPAKQEPKKKLQRFIRIVQLPLAAGDTFTGYQPELIWVDGDKVVRRKLVDKPNLFEFAYSSAGELVDPRNESVAYDE